MDKTKEQLEAEEKELNEKAKKMAEIVKAELGLDEIKKDIMGSVSEVLKAKESASIMKVFVAEDTQKSIDELTKEERVKVYARALFTGDTAVLKTLSEGTPADGGFTVPQDFYATLLEEIQEVAVMRPRVTIIPMSTNVKTFAEIAHGPDVYWTAEGATKTTTTADFAQPTITAYKMAAIIYLTDELIDDSKFDLVNVLVRRFAERIATEEDAVIINGSGVGRPTGIFVNATVPTRNCTAVGLTFDDIIRLIGDLPVKFRAGAYFLINPAIVTELRLLKDVNGRYLWQDPVAAGQPATIHGYPVIENYWVPVTQIAFGDYRYAYYLGDRQRMTVKITNDTETTFTQDKTAIRVVERIGGDITFGNAVRKIIAIP